MEAINELTGEERMVIEDAVITAGLNLLSGRIEETNKKNGFWEAPNVDVYRKLMLIVSELGELTEGLRDGNPPDKHLPAFTSAEVEAADIVIRMIDLTNQTGWRLQEAIQAKMAYNATREYMHGRKF